MSEIVRSGRAPLAKGGLHVAGLTVRPEEMLDLLHDTQPGAPIPFDAQFIGIGIEDKGADSRIRFFYESVVNPLENCVELNPHHFLTLLKQQADGMIPLDAELDGIEVSNKFTIILLRLKSDKFPPHVGNALPLIHLRYEGGQLALLSPLEAIKKDRRIQISTRR